MKIRSPYNPMTLTDGYKLDHRRQYPAVTTRVYANWTARGSRVPGQTHVCAVGFRPAIQRLLVDEMEAFFAMDVHAVKRQYAERVNKYLGPNTIGTAHIEALHALGHVPLEIRAVPEGTMVPLRVPMLTIENTHPDFAWLVNYWETALSNTLWLPMTSATNALRIRALLDRYADKTGSPKDFVPWQGHDFSMRGMEWIDGAAASGLGHLVAFTGTDTLPALDLIEDSYFVPKGTLLGGSVAATEHSVMCAGGAESELATFERILDLYPEGIVSVVSDTWDFWHVLTVILPQLKDRILARNGKVVIRPDSGVPFKILVGDADAPEGSPAWRGAVAILWDLFGGTTTATGHRLLDSHIGLIYGDGINEQSMGGILAGLDHAGFASGNMVFGIGSYSYQLVTRDTFNFAMKSTWVEIDGVGHAIFKDPKTDSGTKRSLKGRLAVREDFTVIEEASPADEARSILQPIWRNGTFLSIANWVAVRDRAGAFYGR